MTDLKNAKGFWRASTRAVLTLLILCLGLISPSSAAEPPATDASVLIFPRLVKAKVQALGLGAVVKISTVFRRKHYRGYITRIDEDSFELTDVATLAPNTFKYSVVNKVAGRPLPDPANQAGKRGVTSVFHIVSKLGFGP